MTVSTTLERPASIQYITLKCEITHSNPRRPDSESRALRHQLIFLILKKQKKSVDLTFILNLTNTKKSVNVYSQPLKMRK